MTMRALPFPAAPPTPRFLASMLHCSSDAHDHAALRPRDTDCAYCVAWAINPHMRIGASNLHRALGQHCHFIRCLEAAGSSVVRLPFVHAAHDSVFAKDNAVLRLRGGAPEALLAQLVHPERRPEQRARQHALERAGFRVHAPPTSALEGGDVVVRPGGGAFLGWGFRSSALAAGTLERFLDAPVVALRLSDPHLYHLDMALTVLADGTTLVCEEALEPASFRVLARVTTGDLVRISARTARAFGINAVEVRSTVIVGAEHAEVRRVLEARGRRMVVAPLDEFHHAGGSASCLVARLHDPEAQTARMVARNATTAMRSTAA